MKRKVKSIKRHAIVRGGKHSGSGKDGFDIDLDALTGKGKGNGEQKPPKAAKEKKVTAKVAKAKPKPTKKSSTSSGNKVGRRGHPIKGTLKPLKERPYYDPSTKFETMKEARGVFGTILGHLRKTWKMPDAENAVKVLVAKKEIDAKYTKWPPGTAARWMARESLRKKIIRVVK